jgi:hypothetical protein
MPNRTPRPRVRVAIESAECLVPRRGAQETRIGMRDELRRSDPAMAVKVEAILGQNEDTPYSGDDFATLSIEWTVEPSDETRTCNSQFPIGDLPFSREHALTTPKREPESWVEYRYHLKASFAFDVFETLEPDSAK